MHFDLQIHRIITLIITFFQLYGSIRLYFLIFMPVSIIFSVLHALVFIILLTMMDFLLFLPYFIIFIIYFRLYDLLKYLFYQYQLIIVFMLILGVNFQSILSLKFTLCFTLPFFITLLIIFACFNCFQYEFIQVVLPLQFIIYFLILLFQFLFIMFFQSLINYFINYFQLLIIAILAVLLFSRLLLIIYFLVNWDYCQLSFIFILHLFLIFKLITLLVPLHYLFKYFKVISFHYFINSARSIKFQVSFIQLFIILYFMWYVKHFELNQFVYAHFIKFFIYFINDGFEVKQGAMVLDWQSIFGCPSIDH